jgi:CarD family transcriptional regulator
MKIHYFHAIISVYYGEDDFMEFQIGDQVVYGAHGVCKIVDLIQQTVDRKKRTFYVLEALGHCGMRICFPADNPAVLGQLRPLISREELLDLLASDVIRQNCWIADEGQRKLHYKELISSGDRVSLLQMIHSLQQHKKEQLAQGRKFHLCDDNFLRDAIRLLNMEFSVVLDIPPEDVAAFVLDRLNR